MPGVFVVSTSWLLDSIYNWQRQNETKYLLEPVCPRSNYGNGSIITSDIFNLNHHKSTEMELLNTSVSVENVLNEHPNKPVAKIDWDAMDDEVDDVLNEEDEENEENEKDIDDTEDDHGTRRHQVDRANNDYNDIDDIRNRESDFDDSEWDNLDAQIDQQVEEDLFESNRITVS